MIRYNYLSLIEKAVIPSAAFGAVIGGVYMGCTAAVLQISGFHGYRYRNDYLHMVGVVTVGGVIGGAAGSIAVLLHPVILGAAVIAAPIHQYKKSRSNLK